MDKVQIIEKIAKEGVIENILSNLGCTGANAEDLTQDILLSLFEKDEVLLQDLYEKDELKYYLTKMALNNFNSKTSPFHTTYRRAQVSYGLIEELIDKEKLDD